LDPPIVAFHRWPGHTDIIGIDLSHQANSHNNSTDDRKMFNDEPDDGEYYPNIKNDYHDDVENDHPRSWVFNLLLGVISLIAMLLLAAIMAFGIIKLVEFVR